MKLMQNFTSWLKQWGGSALGVGTRSYTPVQAWLRGEDGVDTTLLVNAMEQSAWVYACVTAISEQIAHAPFVFSLGQKKGEKRIDDGEAVRLFNQPDDEMDRFIFWELVCQWLLLRGKTYVVALDRNGMVLPIRVPDRRGPKPARLVLLNPDRVRAVLSGHELAGYHYDAGMHDPMPARSFLPEEVICVRMAYAYDYLEGLPPLRVARLAAQTDFAAALCMKGLMLNNADAGQIVTTEEHLTEKQIEQFKAALRERKCFAGTADRPLFLTDGARVQTPMLSMADLQFLENRKFNRQEICAIFHVPQEILGFTEDANRSVADAARLSFIENRIAPFCQRLESAMDPIVKRFGPNLWGFFDLDALPLMQAARRMRYQGARQAFEMGVPLNVLNQVFDLGLPSLPHGEQGYLPGNLQEITRGGTAEYAEGAEGGGESTALKRQMSLGAGARTFLSAPDAVVPHGGQECPRSDANSKTLARGHSDPVESLELVGGRGTDGQMDKWADGQMAMEEPGKNGKGGEGDCGWLTSIMRMMESKFSRYIYEQRGRTMGRLEAWFKDTAGTGEPEIFDPVRENAILVSDFEYLLQTELNRVAEGMAATEGKAITIPEADRAHYVQERVQALQEINLVTWARLQESMLEGVQEREGFRSLVKRVKAFFQEAIKERARQLAVAEVRVALAYSRSIAALEKD